MCCRALREIPCTVTRIRAPLRAGIVLASGALLTLNGDGSFAYDPNGAFTGLADGEPGSDGFTYTLTDGELASNAATVTIAFTGENDAPVARDDDVSTLADALLHGDVTASNGHGFDFDPDAGDSFTITAVNGNAGDVGQPITLPSGALLTLNASGSFVYDPNGQFTTLGLGETGSDSFTYTIADSLGATDQATVNVSVTGFLPNLTVADVVLPSGLGEQAVLAHYTIENNGAVPATGGYVERLYLSTDGTLDGGDTLLRSLSFAGDLAAGGSYNRSVQVDLPAEPGDYRLLVRVDAENAIAEIDEGDNIGVSATASVAAAYEAAILTAPTTAPINGSVMLTGRATQIGGTTPVPFEFVTIEAETGGFTRAFHVLSDLDGNFSFAYVPLPGEAGEVTFTARHPGQPNEDAAPEASTLLFGMTLANNDQAGSVIEGQSVDFDFVLSNVAGLDLTMLEAQLIGLAPAKQRIRETAARLLVDRVRGDRGPGRGRATQRMAFTGMTGTGKTMGAPKRAGLLPRLG